MKQPVGESDTHSHAEVVWGVSKMRKPWQPTARLAYQQGIVIATCPGLSDLWGVIGRKSELPESVSFYVSIVLANRKKLDSHRTC